MRVEVPLLSYDRTSLQKIYLTSSGENLAKLELRDFSFGLPGEEIPVGDIVVEDIDLKAPGDAENATITLEPKTVTVTLSPEIGSAQVAINGTVVAGKLSLTINVSEALAVDRVNVTFSGDKMASDNELSLIHISMPSSNGTTCADRLLCASCREYSAAATKHSYEFDPLSESLSACRYGRSQQDSLS